MKKMSGTIVPNDVLRQEKSMTPSSSGSSWNRRPIMTGLQNTVQEYLKAPLVDMLPLPLFTSTSSVRLEEGSRQISAKDLSDQDSQESRKNAWKNLRLGGIATPK